MKKINIGKRPFMYPMPISLVGTIIDKKPNFMAVGWIAPVNYDPPMIGIALGKMHYTNIGIREQKAFSVCIPNKELIQKTDYCGIVSGKKIDKSTIFSISYEGYNNISLINECPICIQVKLDRIVDLPSNELFIGEVLNTLADKSCLTDGKPDIKKLNPFTLTMPDKKYWSVGEFIGYAWKTGKDFKESV